ncbi:site-specific integrase [Streptomyces cinnamoneus]|uniref:tyrosine-type recombinase/integrase n=1 Tax=Streptomyces cinnamoneus TaxID=53446 RepID=UPI0033CEC1A7
MAGHIQDRWYKTEVGVSGRPVKVKTDRHGKGMRYRARYVAPDGTEKSRSFPDKQKRLADAWLAQIEADLVRGLYIDPHAGKVTFETYATAWLRSQTSDISTVDTIDQRLRLHVFPHIGGRSMNAFLPGHIRAWGRALQDGGLSVSYRRVTFANVSAIFSAAMDDGLIAKNPCRAGSVRPPKAEKRKVKPWPLERVLAVRSALPERYRKVVDVGAGCGLRQGEVFGLAADTVDCTGGVLHVVRQIKMVRTQLIFAPPKGNKLREVPLSEEVAAALTEHMAQFPPLAVTLPWRAPDGPPVTASLLFYSRERKAVNRNYFNMRVWKPALVGAGVIAEREPGKLFEPSSEHGMHALRHFYASLLLDEGENVKALAEYLGHSDPGFTLRTYTHLMPSSQARARRAVDRAFRRGGGTGDGPQTAQGTETPP